MIGEYGTLIAGGIVLAGLVLIWAWILAKFLWPGLVALEAEETRRTEEAIMKGRRR